MMTERVDLYLIWSNEHGGWWRPGQSGYTTRLAGAGRYTRHEALAICFRAMPGAKAILNELPVREVDALEMQERYERTFPGRYEAWA